MKANFFKTANNNLSNHNFNNKHLDKNNRNKTEVKPANINSLLKCLNFYNRYKKNEEIKKIPFDEEPIKPLKNLNAFNVDDDKQKKILYVEPIKPMKN